jgi:replication factor C subunit 3/5
MKPAEKWWPMIVYFILLMFMYMMQVQGGDFPHLLVYGPSGAGKKTRIMCLLREMYGAGVEKLRIEQHTFTTPSNKKIEISTISSNYHIEVNPR